MCWKIEMKKILITYKYKNITYLIVYLHSSHLPLKMASKCPIIRAAEIAREAKKMQIELHKEQLKILKEEYKLLEKAVKDEKERFKNNKESVGPRIYKDNAKNRKFGRVGLPIPSKKKVKNETESAAGNYVSDGVAKESKAKPQKFYKIILITAKLEGQGNQFF